VAGPSATSADTAERTRVRRAPEKQDHEADRALHVITEHLLPEGCA